MDDHWIIPTCYCVKIPTKETSPTQRFVRARDAKEGNAIADVDLLSKLCQSFHTWALRKSTSELLASLSAKTPIWPDW
jgi:hypothetical protein